MFCLENDGAAYREFQGGTIISLFLVSFQIHYMSLNMLIKIYSMVNESDFDVMRWKIN